MTEFEEIYVSTTETLYPGETEFDQIVVRLYGRNKDHEARTVTVKGFEPYFLVRADEQETVAPADHEDLVGYEEVDIDPLSERFDKNPTDLVRVNFNSTYFRNIRKEFSKSWGADCLFSERFRIDKNIRTGVKVPTDKRRDDHIIVDHDEVEAVEIEDVEPRVVTLDIETDDRDAGFPDPGDARILSIAVHDSYTEEYEVFLDLDGESFGSFFDLNPTEKARLADDALSLSDIGVTEPDRLTPAQSEKKMLDKFGKYIQDIDPDLITGWNSGDEANDGFDLPHIIARMKSVGASVRRLSREDDAYNDERGDDFMPNITGRALYDLMDGWGDTKFTKPRSFKLNDVAEKALDDTKIEHQDMGYFEMYSEDPVKFVNYNVKDTRLTVDINEAENVLGFKKRLKDMVGVDWHRTHENNEFIEMSVRRKCAEHDLAMITAWDNPEVIKAHQSGNDGVNYEGAHVESAFCGVKKNVCGVDLTSLYPMTQWMLNASPDTRIEVEKGTPEWYELKDEIDGQYVEAANGQMFRTDHDGIIRELVDEYHEVKAEFKAQRNSAEYGTDLWEEYAEAYNVTKTIYNSFYGYSGWDRSPLYNPQDAAAITLTGQRVIKATAEYISNHAVDGVEVVYGDTDSNYVEFPSSWSQEETLEYAMELCERLENEVYTELCDEFYIPREDNRWEMEVEMRAKRFFMWDSKKQYAYLKMWDEGGKLDEKVKGGEGKFSVTGAACVKSNFSLMTKEVQEEVLEQIVRGADKAEVVETVHNAAASIDAANPDWDYLGVPQGLGKKTDPKRADEDDFYSWSTTGDHPRDEAPRAAWFANHLLDVKFDKGDNPKRAKVKPGETVRGEQVDVIAYDSHHALIGTDLRIDASEMQRKCLENPLDDVLDAFGVETKAALRGNCESQSGLEAFI